MSPATIESRLSLDSFGHVYLHPGGQHGAVREFRVHNGVVQERHGDRWETLKRGLRDKGAPMRCSDPARLLGVISCELQAYWKMAHVYLEASKGH